MYRLAILNKLMSRCRLYGERLSKRVNIANLMTHFQAISADGSAGFAAKDCWNVRCQDCQAGFAGSISYTNPKLPPD